MSKFSSKYGISSWFGIELPLDERLRLIREAGFESTSVWLGDEEDLVKKGKGHLIPELVRNHGLFFENVHAPFDNCNKIWSDDSSIRDEIKNEYKSCISFCSRYDVPIVVIHISRGDDAPKLNRHGIAALREIVRYAEDSGVIVAIENTRKYHYLDEIYDSIESPALGFCYDSSHDYLWSPEPGLILEKRGHLLVATHISDNDRMDDKHWLPGKGIIDWEIIGSCFPGETYTGIITLEVVPECNTQESAQMFLKKAFEGIQRIIRVFCPQRI